MSHVEPLNWERHTVSFGGVEARGEGGHQEMMMGEERKREQRNHIVKLLCVYFACCFVILSN
jgi:hypothetical protein